jgi:hypothetical protein
MEGVRKNKLSFKQNIMRNENINHKIAILQKECLVLFTYN